MNNGKNKNDRGEIEQLVKYSQEGNSDAFGSLYDAFVTPIYKYIYYRVGGEEAEDLTELVFLKTWENIKQYRHGYRNFSSWIFRIAHNVVVDYYRSKTSNGELYENIEDERIDSSAIQRAHNHFDQKILHEAMKELKDQYKQILILKYVNDLSNEEIGYITGKSQAALRILQFIALRSLRKILEHRGIKDFEA